MSAFSGSLLWRDLPPRNTKDWLYRTKCLSRVLRQRAGTSFHLVMHIPPAALWADTNGVLFLEVGAQWTDTLINQSQSQSHWVVEDTCRNQRSGVCFWRTDPATQRLPKTPLSRRVHIHLWAPSTVQLKWKTRCLFSLSNPFCECHLTFPKKSKGKH